MLLRTPGRPKTEDKSHGAARRRPTVAAVAFAAFVSAAIATGEAWAQPSPPARDVAEALTKTLSELAAEHGARGVTTSRTRRMLGKVAAQRREQLAALVEEDPGAVLELVLSKSDRGRLPREARRHLETEVEIEGTVEVLVEDHDAGSRTLHSLETRHGRRFSLHFAGDAPALATGDRIRVRGVHVPRTRAVAVGADGMAVETLAAAQALVSGGQRTLVVLVNFQDNATQPYTPASAASVIFDTTSRFYREASGDRLWLEGDVYGWFTIAVSGTTCDYNAISSAARSAAAAAGAVLSSYSRHVYAFPKNACTWWGLGTIGGNPSQAWINGSLQLMVAGHELGHNLGLYHSNALECGTAAVGSGCSTINYGDTLDIMGNSRPGHFNAFQKSRLGWVDLAAVTSAGRYRLSPYETGGADPMALEILKSIDPATGKRTWYYLEHRRAIGFDSFLSTNANVPNGLVIHTGSEASGNSSYLLDMTPATTSWTDPALVVGASFHDPDAGVTITPVAVAAEGITVDVSFGGLACVPAAPRLTLSPPATQWTQAGGTVAYAATVTNNDSAACAAGTFAVDTLAPAEGWTASASPPALALAPGASATTTVSVTSPLGAGDGVYDIGVEVASAAEPTLSASALASYGIASALDVTTWPEKPGYNTRDLVAVWTLVEAAGAPMAGADVVVTIRNPNGRVVTLTAVTGATGYAQASYRLRRDDPAGTYDVTAAAGAAPGPVGSGATTFSVTKPTSGGGKPGNK